MSDVHCPVCLIMSCKSDVSSSEKNSDQITKTEYAKCKWSPDLSNKYTASFNLEVIQQFQLHLSDILSQIINYN